MTSLFDVAAGLSQYDDAGEHHGLDQASTGQLSMLSLVDDTLLSIYASSKRPTTKETPSSLSMPIIPRADPAPVDSSRRSRPPAVSPPPPLRLPAVVKPNEATPALNNQLNASIRSPSNMNADLMARNVLRDITEEMAEQLSVVTTPDAQLIRMLEEKYLETRLSKLPKTPFVQLACRKVQQKIDQLSQCTAQSASPLPAKTDDQTSEMDPAQQQPDHVVATWHKLQTLTPEQQQMLRNLVSVPSSRLLKLPPAQQELVRFAKRYEKLLTLTPQDLLLLPKRHQQLISKMQRQRQASLPLMGNQ